MNLRLKKLNPLWMFMVSTFSEKWGMSAGRIAPFFKAKPRNNDVGRQEGFVSAGTRPAAPLVAAPAAAGRGNGGRRVSAGAPLRRFLVSSAQRAIARPARP